MTKACEHPKATVRAGVGGASLRKLNRLMPPTNVQGKVAETAWRAWPLIYREGPQTLVQLRKKLTCTDELLEFALGWLAWENKILIHYERNILRVEPR